MEQESIYAGGFNLAVSPTDVRVELLSVSPVFMDGQISDTEIKTAGKFAMSLPLAKQFCRQLSEMLDRFEKSHGTILDLDDFSADGMESRD